MRTAAILPVKRFAEAKSRLGSSLAAPLRRELAGAMVADVLLALSHSKSIERTILVSSEQRLSEAAAELGALVVPDGERQGQSAAVAHGVRVALARGYRRVLCIPGDCPALDPAEIDLLLADDRDKGAAQVVIVPDRHGTGTNGLLLAPPDAIAPSFGPDSCERHRLAARTAGVSCRLERPPSLLLDIDTGADLEALRARIAQADFAGAARTRALLREQAAGSSAALANAG